MKRSSVHGILLSGAILSAFALASCSGILGGGGDDDGPTGSTTNTVLPNTVMVTVPASLVGDAGAGGALRALRSSRSLTTDRAEEAYTTIKYGVAEMKMNGATVAMYGAILDELISSQNLTPQTAQYTGKTMTLTQALVDKVNAFAASAGFDVNDLSSMVGQTETVPDFYYQTETPTATAPYDRSLRMTQTGTDAGVAYTSFTGFYWSTDKKQVKMVMADADPATATPTYTYTITYNDVTKTSAMVMDGSYDGTSYAYTFSLKEDDASTNHGAFVFYESSYSFDADNDGTNETWNQSGTGYADDLGGTLKVTVKTGTGLSAQVETYETAFDATTIDASKAAAYSDEYAQIDDSMYTEVSETAASSGESTSYSMETKVVALNGVVSDGSAFYILFDARLQRNGADIEAADAAVDLGTQSSELTNINSVTYIGSGYGSDVNELTAYLDTSATTAYVYSIVYDAGQATSFLKYIGPITF